MKQLLVEKMNNDQKYWIFELARIEADTRAFRAAKDKSISDEKLTEMIEVANELYNMSVSMPYCSSN